MKDEIKAKKDAYLATIAAADAIFGVKKKEEIEVGKDESLLGNDS